MNNIVARVADAALARSAPSTILASAQGRVAARVRAIVKLSMARTVRTVPLSIGLLIAALPLVFAALFQSSSTGDPAALSSFLMTRYESLVITLLLPLAALLTAAGATSAEREDGTLLYLLTTTTSRPLIIAVRWILATVLTSVLVLASVIGTALIAGNGSDSTGVMRAFAMGSVAGAAVYSALFLAMAVWVRRSLLVGLLYVLVWEGTIAGNFPAVRFLSARQVTLGMTESFLPEAERGAALFSSAPGATASMIWAAAVTVLALVLAAWRLTRLPVQRGR